MSVYVDIFVYDNAPDDDEMVRKMYDRRDQLRRRYTISNQHISTNESVPMIIARLFRKMIYRVLYRQNFIQQMVTNATQFGHTETSRVGNFTSFARIVCDKRVFSDFIEIEFEG